MAMTKELRLGVNIDHVATLRNARGGAYPDPVEAACLAESAGADGITAHLREDRRHIMDADIKRMTHMLSTPLNLEMAATDEMQKIALLHRPHAVCIVPEKREERTTEGGLNILAEKNRIGDFIAPLTAMGARVSLFIAPEREQVEAAADIGAAVVELHTGSYADFCCAGNQAGRDNEYQKLTEMARYGESLGLEIHAGHGLNYDNVALIAAIKEVRELNIGHFLISQAVFMGLRSAIHEMRRLIVQARGGEI